MDDLALNTSRSRRRRDSQGSPKHQRKSIHAENGTADEIRRVSSAATTRELTKSQDREQMVNLRRKGRDNDRLGGEKSDNKRASSIVLDVNSILDELVGDSRGSKESPAKTSSRLGTDRTPARRNTPSPVLRVESAEPPQQPKKGKALETTVTRSSRLVRNGSDDTRSRDKYSSTTTTTTSTSVSTSSPVSDKRPPIAPAKKMSSPGRLRTSYDSSSTRNSASSPVEDKSGRPPSRSPDMKEEAKDVLKQSSPSRRIYSNGIFKDANKEDDESEAYYRSRTRSNAISKNESHHYSSKVIKDDKIDEAEPPSPKLRDKSKRRSHIDSIVEMRPERSGSWNRMRQLVNSKALGMFYHNRRSQALDHDSLDESESRLNSDRGSSLEPSDSSTSPTILSPRSRESRSFSPGVRSPLASKHQPQGFDEAHKSLLDKKEREESSAASPSAPTAASSLAPPHTTQDEEEPQVHINTACY